MHTNLINNKVYIGITKVGLEQRARKDGNHYAGSPYFYSAIQKYGWDNFKHEILLDNLTEKEVKEQEKYFIDKYKSNDREYGYNLTEGGDGVSGLGTKQVYQYDLATGELVKVFKSRAEAEQETGISNANISQSTIHMNKTAGGFFWSNTELTQDEIDDRLKCIPKKTLTCTIGKKKAARNKIIAIEKADFSKTYTFNTQKEAANTLKVSPAAVSTSCASKGETTTHGFRFMWEEDYLKFIEERKKKI